jgi:hypothetical protein
MCNASQAPAVSVFTVEEFTLMMKAAGSSETVLLFYSTPRHHIPEDSTFQNVPGFLSHNEGRMVENRPQPLLTSLPI